MKLIRIFLTLIMLTVFASSSFGYIYSVWDEPCEECECGCRMTKDCFCNGEEWVCPVTSVCKACPEPEVIVKTPTPRTSNLKFDSVNIRDYYTGDEYTTPTKQGITVFVTLENTYLKDMEKIKLAVVVEELGLRRALGPFSLDNDDRVNMKIPLIISEDTEPGEYWVRITAYDYDTQIRRIIYRVLVVQ